MSAITACYYAQGNHISVGAAAVICVMGLYHAVAIMRDHHRKYNTKVAPPSRHCVMHGLSSDTATKKKKLFKYSSTCRVLL